MIRNEKTTTDALPQEVRDEGFSAYRLVSDLRNHGNYTLGLLLTAVEAALGDGKQSEALKAIVRREMFALIDRNQAEVYESSGDQERGITSKRIPEIRIDGQDGNATE